MKEQIKPELNNKSKARFFAQYWAQKVAKWIDHTPRIINYLQNPRPDVCYVKEVILSDKGWFLELNPLSDITDEDYTELMMKKYQYQPWSAFKRPNLIPETFNQEQTDYLRSLGYALPWMGHSVEDMVKAGWVKLKGDNNG